MFFANKFAPTACGQKLGITFASAVGRESVFREQVRSYGLRPEAEGSRFASAVGRESVFREQVRSYGLRPEAGDHGLLLPQGVRVFFANKFAPAACGQKLGITVCFCPKGVGANLFAKTGFHTT
ncbi:hypothetical protein VT47_22625 [Pseudomonas syringae pv. syringae]|nr:hypothetical protein VT47_22625 [Pseudomonas syringae pv. syringae]